MPAGAGDRLRRLRHAVGLRRPLPEQRHALPRLLRSAPNVVDQGAKLLSAVASIIDSRDPQEIAGILDGLPDFLGYAYRFGLPASLLQRSLR